MNFMRSGMQQELLENPGHDTGEIDEQEAAPAEDEAAVPSSEETTEKGEDAIGTKADDKKEPARRGRKRKKESDAEAAVSDDGEPADSLPAGDDGSDDVQRPDAENEDRGEAGGDVPAQADGPGVEQTEDDAPDGEEDDGPDGAQEEQPVASEAPARSRPRSMLDSSGRVIRVVQDAGQQDISILSAAWNNRRVLTANLDSYEADGNGKFQVFFYVGKVKVIIPFDQMGFAFDVEDPDPVDIRLQIDSMLGAVIDYMVRGIDVDNLVAVGSRRDAMIVRQRTILNRRDRNGEYLVGVGTQCMARALHISRQFVRVEVFGYVTDIRINAISNLWINDVREVMEIGGEYPVEILELERDGETGQVTHMRVSMQAAEEQSKIEMVEGNTYTGTICSISRTAYYVKVNGVPADVRCPLRSNHVAGMMVGDMVKFYVRAIYPESISGAITKILKRPDLGAF